jgi:hypothetical protein
MEKNESSFEPPAEQSIYYFQYTQHESIHLLLVYFRNEGLLEQFARACGAVTWVHRQ